MILCPLSVLQELARKKLILNGWRYTIEIGTTEAPILINIPTKRSESVSADHVVVITSVTGRPVGADDIVVAYEKPISTMTDVVQYTSVGTTSIHMITVDEFIDMLEETREESSVIEDVETRKETTFKELDNVKQKYQAQLDDMRAASNTPSVNDPSVTEVEEGGPDDE